MALLSSGDVRLDVIPIMDREIESTSQFRDD